MAEDWPAVKGIIIRADKTLTDVEVGDLASYQAAVEGNIEAVTLSDGTTMYVNEEYRYQFGPEAFNSVASDVCGLGGRLDIMLHGGILGPVLVVGPVDDDGYDTDITDRARRWIRRVHREATV